MTTESDRELLELAAKAYWGDEIDDVCSIRWLEQDQAIGYTHGDNQDHNGQDREFVWNPLTDDGDALRLAVKLHIGVRSHGPDHWQQPNVTVALWDFGEQAGRVTVAHGDDPQRATRHAIVRAAAAEIARATHKEQT